MSTNSLAGIQRSCPRFVRAQARRRNAQIRTQTHSHRGTARTQTETPVGRYSLKQLDVSDRAFELVRVRHVSASGLISHLWCTQMTAPTLDPELSKLYQRARTQFPVFDESLGHMAFMENAGGSQVSSDADQTETSVPRSHVIGSKL